VSFSEHENGNGIHLYESVEVPIFVVSRAGKSDGIPELNEEDTVELLVVDGRWNNTAEYCTADTVEVVEEDKVVFHREIARTLGVVLDKDLDSRVECSNSREQVQHMSTQQMDIEDSSEQEQEQWVAEQVERGTSILDSGVETEGFGTVQEPAEEVQGPVAVAAAAAAVAVAVAAVLAVVAVAEVAAAVVVAEVVDTGTVGTSTSFQTGDFPITRIGDCVINSSRDGYSADLKKSRLSPLEIGINKGLSEKCRH
jgi:hypothetical protein